MAYQFLSTILGSNANFTGNVGVGTTTPSYKLTVQDTVNTGTIAIGNVTYPGLIYSSASTGEFRVDNRTSAGAGYITFFPNGQGSTVGSEAMRIVATGNVGIGTATPQGRLNVVSSTTFNTYLINSTSGTGLAFRLYSGYSDILSTYDTIAQNMDITFTPTTISGVQNEAMRIKANGNVLIGTTTDGGQKLQVVGDTKITGATSAGNYSLSVYNSSNAISFYVRGFGDALLAGTLFLGTQNGPNFISNGTLGITSSQGTGNQFIRFTHNNGNNAIRILSNSVIELNPVAGNVLIGTTADNGAKLQVNGTGSFAGDVALNGNRLYIGSVLGNTVLRPISTTNLQLFNANAGAGLFLDANGYVQIGQSNAVNWAYFSASGTTIYGTTTLSTLAGTGTRMVVADASGILSTQAVPTGTVTGSGTTNYVSKWSSSTSLGDSLIYDNGANVGINTNTPGTLLQVKGNGVNMISLQYAADGGSAGYGFYNSAGTELWSIGGGRFVAQDALEFSRQGSLKLLINSAGNVGIGTTSPTAKLTVVGEGTGLALIGNPGFVGSNYTAISLNNTLSTSSYNFLSSPTDATLYINRPSGVSIRFREANGANQMVIETGGNVLIGTSTDNGEKLQVNGNATIGSSGGSNSITINGGPNGTASYYGSGVGNGSWDSRPNGNAPYINQWHTGLTFSANSYYGGIRFYNQGYPNVYSSTLVMSVTNDAVGIGTTSPSSKLHVDNPGYSFIAGYDAGNRRVYVGLDSSGEPSIQSALSNGAPRQLDINPLGGNVGIGTTTPTEKLSVNGNMAFPKSGNTFIYNDQSGADSITIGGASYFSVKTFNGANYTEVFRATATNNLLIGTTTDNGYRLQVSGRASIYTGATVTDSVAFSVADGSNGLNYIPYVGTGSYNNLSYGGGSLLFNNISSRLTVGTHNGTAIQFGPSDTLISGAITLFSLGGSGTRMVVANASGVLSTQAIPGGGAIKAYGSWQSNNTQLSPANNFPTPVIYDVVNFNNNISVDLDFASQYTLITMLVDGVFNIQFSFQFRNLSSSDQDVYVWFRKNGQTQSDDIANSNTLISVPAKHGSGTPGHTVAAWNFFVQATANDYYQIVWATSDKNNVSMEYIPPTPFGPGSPSSILTVNKVD